MNNQRSLYIRVGKVVMGDVFLNMLMAFVLLFIILPHNPKQSEEKVSTVNFGDMTILVSWPDKIDVDIDLWVQCPLDTRAVGYTNRAGTTCNLQRDDLGKSNDTTDLNFEIVSTRGLPAGEYIVNLHYFKNRESYVEMTDVPVKVVVSTRIKGSEYGGMKEIISRPFAVLRAEGEEITVVRFVIRDDGELDKDSVNDFFEELRTWIQSPL